MKKISKFIKKNYIFLIFIGIALILGIIALIMLDFNFFKWILIIHKEVSQ